LKQDNHLSNWRKKRSVMIQWGGKGKVRGGKGGIQVSTRGEGGETQNQSTKKKEAAARVNRGEKGTACRCGLSPLITSAEKGPGVPTGQRKEVGRPTSSTGGKKAFTTF